MKFRRYCQPLFNEAAPDGGDTGGGATPPATPPADAPPAPLINDDLSFAEGYQDRVGEHAAGLTFKNLPDVFKSVREGTQTITRLNQELAELKKAGGAAAPPQIPADVAGYRAAIQLPEQLPEGIEVPDDMLDEAAKYAHENGIPPEVTNKFVAFQIEQAAKEVKSFADSEFAAIQKAKAEISSTVGPENYDTTISNAKAAHDLLGLTLSERDLIQNPTLVTSLARIHTKLAPGTLREIGVGKEGQTAEGKLQQANDMLSNEQNPHYAAFHDQSHPNHQAAMDHYNRLILESAGGR